MLSKGRILFYNLPKKSDQLPFTNAGIFFKAKLKGGALYIAILVSIIIGIILSMFILIANYNQRTVTVYTQSSQLQYNIKSAFEIAQSEYFTDDKNDRWMKNITNDDSIKIKKLNWGAYLLITAQTKNRHQTIWQCGLYGTSMPADTGLMISDNGRPVGLSGAVSFKSNCYLPKAGIKSAYIEGQSFISAPQNQGFIKNSPTQIPQVDKDILEKIQQESNANVYLDSIGSFSLKKYNQSFINKTLVFEISSGRLSDVHLENNIKIIAKNIEIDSTCHLENVLIICEKVTFNEGFTGSVHVIASDSIITEKKCRFDYPSSFVIFPKNEMQESLRSIIINEECVFFGGMLALNKNNGQSKATVFVKLNAKSQVNGFIYSSGFLHLEGQANATLICDKLLLKTPSAVYENHMLACEIDPKKYAHLLAVPQIFKKTARLMCCCKLN